jgi:hypothetical protein
MLVVGSFRQLAVDIPYELLQTSDILNVSSGNMILQMICIYKYVQGQYIVFVEF